MGIHPSQGKKSCSLVLKLQVYNLWVFTGIHNTVYHQSRTRVFFLFSTEQYTPARYFFMPHIKWKQLQKRFLRMTFQLKLVVVVAFLYIYRCSSHISSKIDTKTYPIVSTFIWVSIVHFAQSMGSLIHPVFSLLKLIMMIVL